MTKTSSARASSTTWTTTRKTTRTRTRTSTTKKTTSSTDRSSPHLGRAPIEPRSLSVVFALGGNLGRPDAVERRFHEALDALAAHLGPLRVSRLYRTEAVTRAPSSRSQPDYSNAVAAGQLQAADPERAARWLLATFKTLEVAAGRTVRAAPEPVRDLPRPLDLDLLVMGDEILDLPALAGVQQDDEGHWPGAIRVPHPQIAERRFVLAPLADLVPGLILPDRDDGKTVQDLLDALPPDGPAVRPVPWQRAPAAADG